MERYLLVPWLATEGLQLSKFTDIVDRAYVVAPVHGRGGPRNFVAVVGRPAAQAYARRKRRFAGLSSALDDALISGAMPGDIAPDELSISTSVIRSSRPEDLLNALERIARGQE